MRDGCVRKNESQSQIEAAYVLSGLDRGLVVGDGPDEVREGQVDSAGQQHEDPRRDANASLASRDKNRHGPISLPATGAMRRLAVIPSTSTPRASPGRRVCPRSCTWPTL